MKRAIVVGATSGIGRQLALLLADAGYMVGATGRRLQLLEELKVEKPGNIITSCFDITHINEVNDRLDQLTEKLGGLDLLILSSGTGDINKALHFRIEKHTIDVNVSGFTAVSDWAFNYFRHQQSGQLAAITSIAGIRGSKMAPAYNASKAYQVNYLEGLRQKAKNLKMPIHITDVRPGFVKTDMAKGEGVFWVAPVEKAARQIFRAIMNKRDVVYITKRWRLIAALFRLIPGSIYKRM